MVCISMHLYLLIGKPLQRGDRPLIWQYGSELNIFLEREGLD